MFEDYWGSRKISRLEKKLAKQPAAVLETAAQMLRDYVTNSDDLLDRIEDLFRKGTETNPDSTVEIVASLLCLDKSIPERSWFALLDIVRQSDLDIRLKTTDFILKHGTFPTQTFSDVFNPVHHLAKVYADSMAEDADRTLSHVPLAFMECQRHNNRCMYPPYSRALYLLSRSISAYATKSPVAAITAAGDLFHRIKEGTVLGVNPGTVEGFISIVRAGLTNEDPNVRAHAASVAADMLIETYDLNVSDYKLNRFYDVARPLATDFRIAVNAGYVLLNDLKPSAVQFFKEAAQIARDNADLADLADREIKWPVRAFNPDPEGPHRRAVARIARDFRDLSIA